jgi:hypothetical protein
MKSIHQSGMQCVSVRKHAFAVERSEKERNNLVDFWEWILEILKNIYLNCLRNLVSRP